jgi:DnaJ-domain-containing protein 1
LSETLNFKLDARPLLLEAGRRTPPKFVASRFRVPSELISPGAALTGSEDLLPTEVFLLSRLDRPTPLNEVIAVSGLSENETLVLVYSLSLTGLLQREHWKNALGSRMAVTEPEPEKPTAPEPALEKQSAEEEVDVESFLARVNNAQTHYEVLNVSNEASPAHMKTKYYDLARRYHPDRFRKEDASLVARMESAFARITQAYDTLRDDGLRASYDAKLRARQKAQQLADAAPKPAATPVTPTSAKPETSVKDAAASLAERAEKQFKEGFAALELGERKAALGLFASAATAVPNEARYRAFYGQLLAEQEHTRRAAETELQAAVKLDPKNGEYRVILAALYRDLGLMLRARGEAERALEADPNNRRARDLLRALKSV